MNCFFPRQTKFYNIITIRHTNNNNKKGKQLQQKPLNLMVAEGIMGCTMDSQCSAGEYCYTRSGLCARCTDCQGLWNREPSELECPQKGLDCGPCLPGYQAELLFNMKEQESCMQSPSTTQDTTSVSPPPLPHSETQSQTYLWILVPVVSSFLLIALLVGCFYWNKKKPAIFKSCYQKVSMVIMKPSHQEENINEPYNIYFGEDQDPLQPTAPSCHSLLIGDYENHQNSQSDRSIQGSKEIYKASTDSMTSGFISDSTTSEGVINERHYQARPMDRCEYPVTTTEEHLPPYEMVAESDGLNEVLPNDAPSSPSPLITNHTSHTPSNERRESRFRSTRSRTLNQQPRALPSSSPLPSESSPGFEDSTNMDENSGNRCGGVFNIILNNSVMVLKKEENNLASICAINSQVNGPQQEHTQNN